MELTHLGVVSRVRLQWVPHRKERLSGKGSQFLQDVRRNWSGQISFILHFSLHGGVPVVFDGIVSPKKENKNLVKKSECAIKCVLDGKG